MDKPVFEVSTEYRQVGKTMEFPAWQVRYIDWDKINQTRTELGSDLHVTSHKDGSLTIVFSWKYSKEEYEDAYGRK